ncbi:MAG: DUF58 domain-containing protein [Planctomycetes bacterium]|nr:DUF58 domain-containing protein [Planctomycetota bacterium]
MTDESEAELSQLLAEVRRIEVRSRRLVTDVMAGRYSSVFRGAGLEFEEVREYVPGDDPRSVDWNVTARIGRPYVKRFVDERELTLWLLADLSHSMDGGFSAWSLRQVQARVVACLALSAVENHDRVGLIGFGDRVQRVVAPRQGSGQALRIVRDTLALRSAGRGTALPAALEEIRRVQRRHAIVFLVSDFLGDGWQDGLARCAQAHDVIAIRLLPPELAPPTAGMMRLRDPETGAARLVDWRHAPSRAAYIERVAAWRSGAEAAMRRAGVDRIDIEVPRTADYDAIARPLLGFFRMRELRGAKR